MKCCQNVSADKFERNIHRINRNETYTATESVNMEKVSKRKLKTSPKHKDLVDTILTSFYPCRNERNMCDVYLSKGVENLVTGCEEWDIEWLDNGTKYDDIVSSNLDGSTHKIRRKGFEERKRNRKKPVVVDGIKLMLRCNTCCSKISVAKELRKEEAKKQNAENRKLNKEKKLLKKKLKRGANYLKDNSQTIRAFEREHVIDKTNSILNDKNLTDLFIALQYRELTPNDYEFLLSLDESVPAKTVSEAKLRSIKETTLVDTAKESGGVCCICLEPFGRLVKRLPGCGHCFHRNCIDTWLGTVSDLCPVDQKTVDL